MRWLQYILPNKCAAVLSVITKLYYVGINQTLIKSFRNFKHFVYYFGALYHGLSWNYDILNKRASAKYVLCWINLAVLIDCFI